MSLPSRHRRIPAVLIWAALLAGPAVSIADAQILVVSPDALFFSHTPGSALPGPQFLAVSSTEFEGLAFTATPALGTWLEVSPANGFTPETLRVSANPAGLAPGAYSDNITIVSATSWRVVPVTLFVAENQSALIATPTVFSFTAVVGAAAPATQLLFVISAISAPTTFTTSVFGGGSWLFVGAAAGVTPAVLEVTVNHFGLLAGTYAAVINVIDPAGAIAQSAHVTLAVTGDSPITVNPQSLDFTAEVGSSVPQSQNLLVASGTGETLEFLASAATFTGGNWLSVAPLSGVTNTFVAVTVNAANLPVGAYGGVVRITALGRTLTAPVTLTVTSGPALVVTPAALAFTAGNGFVPPPQSIFVESAEAGAVAFQAVTGGGNWLSVNPASGTTFATLSVSVNPAGLGADAYSGLVTVLAEGSTIPRTVQVTLTVTSQITIEAKPSPAMLTAQVGDTSLVSQTLSITSNLGNVVFTAGASPVAWLVLSSLSAVTPGSVIVSANPAGLAEGTYHGSVVITAPGAGNSPLSVPVTFTVTPAGPVVAAVLHGASMKPGVLAVGTAVSVFGRGLGPETAAGLEIGTDGAVTTTLAGARALFDGIPAPLIYVHAWQINAMVPYELLGRSLAQVVVEYRGARSAPILIQLFEAAPGIFTMDSSGQGPGAILNQNLGPNSASNPADRGSIVSVFATGAGQMDPPGIDGQVIGSELPLPLLPVKAWVGDQEAQVRYAGGAPGLISGILQINILIPLDLEPGTHQLVIGVGRLGSQAGVTIFVQ